MTRLFYRTDSQHSFRLVIRQEQRVTKLVGAKMLLETIMSDSTVQVNEVLQVDRNIPLVRGDKKKHSLLDELSMADG